MNAYQTMLDAIDNASARFPDVDAVDVLMLIMFILT